ncbi:MAG TPA: FAD-dependent oxidoreductase [Candidatus Saccharimonadales bacterium]
MSVMNMSGLQGQARAAVPTVVVIGGGATGTGIASEASRRGFRVILVERGTLGCGTSSHFHGILHSGGRYAVNDPATAAECYQENQLLRVHIPSAITNTGGLFVALTDDEAHHADKWLLACAKAGIPTEELTPAEALRREPQLNPALKRAFTVPDAFISGAEVIRLNRLAALNAPVPARFLIHHTVSGMQRTGGRITGVIVRDSRTRQASLINCDYVINAAGVWAGRVAALADVRLHMVFDKGTMITFRQELTRAVINRCRPEADGDLLVPSGHGSIMGTTARVISDPDACQPTQEEADTLIREGSAMVPALAQAEATYIYAGVRPLFKASDDVTAPATAGASGPAAAGSTRGISRSFRVLDHSDAGASNFISVVGGKVTLYRKMAEAATDLLCTKNGLPVQGKPSAAARLQPVTR